MNPIENIDITPQQFEEVRSRLVEELEVAPTRTTEEFVSDTLTSINADREDALVYINDLTSALTSPGIHIGVDPAMGVDAIEASLIYNHAQTSIINPSAIIPPVSILTSQEMDSIHSELESFLEDDEPVMEEVYPTEQVAPEVEIEVGSFTVEELVPPVPTVIPVNTIDANSIITSRFSSALWFNKIRETNVILAGVGGIGSYVAFLLSRLDIAKLILYDDDIVGAENLSGQLFSIANIDQPKVNSMNQMLKMYSNFYKTNTTQSKYRVGSAKSRVMICGFDNMAARKVFYESWKLNVQGFSEEEKKTCLFIDGRLAAEEYQILCIQGDDEYSMRKYETEFLFTDEEADPTICSYKQTSFMATQIASTMVNLFVNFVANQCEPIIDRDLPFYTEYNASTMYFKTVN